MYNIGLHLRVTLKLLVVFVMVYLQLSRGIVFVLYFFVFFIFISKSAVKYLFNSVFVLPS